MEKICPRCFKRYEEDIDRCPDDNTRLIAGAEPDLTGMEIDGRYTILRELGRGGMGVVYEAEQAIIGRRVALKVLGRDLARDEQSVKRFLVEAKAIASLKNPHTITLYDFGVTEDGLLYYTMETLKGLNLADLLKQGGPLPFERAADLVIQACDSLREAHAAGILHRDLKPENLFLTRQEGRDFVTVLDFGIARLQGDKSLDNITRTGMLCGTPTYLSPEVVSGRGAGPASDLYAMGVVLFELLTGTLPFRGETAIDVMMKHANEKPPALAEAHPGIALPEGMERLMERLLAKKAEDRPASAAELQDALRVALSGRAGTEPWAPPPALAETQDCEPLTSPLPAAELPTSPKGGGVQREAAEVPGAESTSSDDLPPPGGELKRGAVDGVAKRTWVGWVLLVAVGVIAVSVTFALKDTSTTESAPPGTSSAESPSPDDLPPPGGEQKRGAASRNSVTDVTRTVAPDVTQSPAPDRADALLPPSPAARALPPQAGADLQRVDSDVVDALQPPSPAKRALPPQAGADRQSDDSIVVTVLSTPPGAFVRWMDEKRAPLVPTPAKIVIRPEDDGRMLSTWRRGCMMSFTKVDLAALRTQPEVKVTLDCGARKKPPVVKKKPPTEKEKPPKVVPGKQPEPPEEKPPKKDPWDEV